MTTGQKHFRNDGSCLFEAIVVHSSMLGMASMRRAVGP